MLRHKNIDRICCVILALTLLASALFAGAAATGVISGDGVIGYENRLFDQSRVHTIDIVIDDWDAFLQTCTSEEYAACHLVIDGESCKNVAIRGKGNTSLSSVAAYGNNRYSFKVEFDHYQAGQTYHGLDKLSLNNLIQDNTYMKDYFAYTLMNRMGVASPLCSFVQISVNGEPWGLYLAVEGVEDAFLQRNYGKDYGELYKPDSLSFGGGRGNGRDFDMDEMAENFGFSFDEGDVSSFPFSMPDMGGMPQMPDMPEGFSPEGMNNPFGGGMEWPSASSEPSPTPSPAAPDASAIGEAAPSAGSMPQMSGGSIPDMGSMPQMSGGSMPDMSSMPQMPGGSMPDMGSMPQMPGGSMPDMGSMPQMSGGSMPDMGSMPQMPGGSMPDMGSMPQGFDPGAFPGFSGTDAQPAETQAAPETNGSDGAASSYRQSEIPGKSGRDFSFGPGGFGSSTDVKLQYSDDDPASYANIFNNAKTAVTAADQARLIASLKALGEGDTSVVDTEAVIRYMAVHNFLCNDDSYTGMMVHNYYLYEEDGVLSMIPWDYNLAYGGFTGGNATSTVNTDITRLVSMGADSDRPMAGWITASEEYTAQYLDIYREFIAGTFDSGWFASEFDRVQSMIDPYVQNDPTAFCTYEEFLTGAETLKAFCLKRAESAANQLNGSNTRVDASELNLSVMGTMNGGGFEGGFGGFGGGREERGGERGSKDFGGFSADGAPSAESAGFPGGQSPFGMPGRGTPASTAQNWIWLAVCILLLAAALLAVRCSRSCR